MEALLLLTHCGLRRRRQRKESQLAVEEVLLCQWNPRAPGCQVCPSLWWIRAEKEEVSSPGRKERHLAGHSRPLCPPLWRQRAGFLLLCPPSRQDKHLRSHLPPLNASRSVLIKLSWNLRLEWKTEVMSIPQNNVTEKNKMFDAGHPSQSSVTTCRDQLGWKEWASGCGGHMYTYGRFMLMYGKNHHNIVKQLSSN